MMILQYRTSINADKVHFLHKEDYKLPQIQDCIISWECRLPLQEDGITEIYIEIQKVVLSFRRYLTKECVPDKENIIETFTDKNIRIRFIDKLVRPSIKPVAIYIEFNTDTKKHQVQLIEFSK